MDYDDDAPGPSTHGRKHITFTSDLTTCRLFPLHLLTLTTEY